MACYCEYVRKNALGDRYPKPYTFKEAEIVIGRIRSGIPLGNVYRRGVYVEHAARMYLDGCPPDAPRSLTETARSVINGKI